MASPAVFLDRDGTIIEDSGYVHEPGKVKLLPGAAQAIKQLNEHGFLTITVSNQSGIARGYFAAYITGPWNLGEFRRRLPQHLQGQWTTAPLPGPSGAASGLSMAGGSSLVLFRASKHQQAPWSLVEFLSRPEQQARF